MLICKEVMNQSLFDQFPMVTVEGDDAGIFAAQEMSDGVFLYLGEIFGNPTLFGWDDLGKAYYLYGDSYERAPDRFSVVGIVTEHNEKE